MEFLDERCNICGDEAHSYITLQWTTEQDDRYVKHGKKHMFFNVCKKHRSLYGRMHTKGANLMELWNETLKLNK
jgi:hypothetical protein